MDAELCEVKINHKTKTIRINKRVTEMLSAFFAILSLLIHYGVRIGQAITLKLQNIHWQAGTISFDASKRGNALCLPLHAEVANALLTYIHKARGTAKFQEVFLTVNRSQRPLGKNNDYHAYLKKYYIKAGINFPHQGSRPLRHAFATRLVNKNIPIKSIADLLGHRQIESTFVYTKVNVNQLRKLTRRWPEVV